MNTNSTRCLVLKTTDHGESDRLITLFSSELGKITGMAKGAKRSKKRFVNKLEPFSRIRVHYRASRTSSLLFLTDAELEEAHLTLRQSYRRYASAMYLCELVLQFTKEGDPERELFALLDWAFTSLEGGDRCLKTAALFHIRLLGITGYRPELGYCGQCLQPVSAPFTYTMDPSMGALRCNRCRTSSRLPTRNLSLQTLKFLEKAQGVHVHHLSRLQLSDTSARETLQALHWYSCALLQQDNHSWKNLLSSAA